MFRFDHERPTTMGGTIYREPLVLIKATPSESWGGSVFTGSIGLARSW